MAPIVITRTGELNPVAAPLLPAQKNALWEHIIKTWIDKNPDLFRAMLEAACPEV